MIIHVDGSTTNKQFVYRTFNFRTRCYCGVVAAAALRALVVVSCVSGAMGQGCEGRDFRCVDPTHYAVCLPRELRSQGWTADPEVSCPEGTFCDERSSARCSPQPQSSYHHLVRRLARSLDHAPRGGGSSSSSECPGAGRFPVPGSCSSLLVCVPGLGGLRARRASCPPGAAFDRVSRRCLARRLLPRDPRNAACLQEGSEEAASRHKRSADQSGPAEVLQKRVPLPLPQPQPSQAARSLAAAIFVGANVTEISPAGPYGSCGEGETWDASLGQCMLTDERSIGPRVHCDGRGVFPDRGNPNAYISCDPLVTGEGFVAHRYWCPVNMQFDPTSRVCRVFSNDRKRQRSSEKSRRRTNPFPKSEVASENDEASNPDGAAEREWSQEEETEEKVRSQRGLYGPDSSQSSDTDNESFNDVNGDGQIERSDTKQISDVVRNAKEVPSHSQEERDAKSSVEDAAKMLSPMEANIDPENAKEVLKRNDYDVDERRQLVPSVDSSGSSEEDGIAMDVKSAGPVENRIAFNRGYISVNNEEQGFQGDSEQGNNAFQMLNEAQQHGQMKKAAESAVAVETSGDSAGAKDVFRREEVEQNHQLISGEETGEGRDADRTSGEQKLSETIQNRFSSNVGFVDMKNNEVAFKRDSDQVSAAFQSQNAAQTQGQMTDLGENSIADWTNKVSPLESDSDPAGDLDVIKRGDMEENQLDSDAYAIGGGEETNLQGNVDVEDIEKGVNSDFEQVRVNSRDLSQSQSHDQMKRGQEKSVGDWSNDVSADDGVTGDKKMLKRDEVERGHQQVSDADIGELNAADELQGYVDVDSNGQAAVGESDQLSVASQDQHEAQDANQMKRAAKSFSEAWASKGSGEITDDASVDTKEVLKRDEEEMSHQMLSSADSNDGDTVVGEDELSDSGDLDEGVVYNRLQESLPHVHRPGRRDNVASEITNGETRNSWSKEELVANSYTSDVSGSGGDSRRSLSLRGNGFRLSEGKRRADDVSQNKVEQMSNDIGVSANAPGQYYEGDNLSKGSPNEHSKFVERDVSSSNDQDTSSTDEKRNTGGPHEPHDKFLEEQDEILRQLSSMKQRSVVNKVRDNVEASRERQERSESPRGKKSRTEGNRHIILLKPHERDVPVGEQASEQVNSPVSGNLVAPASLQGTARSTKQLAGDEGHAVKEPTVLHDGHSHERSSARKEKLTVARRQHSEKETKGHSKREENYRTIKNSVGKRESRTFSRIAQRNERDKHNQNAKNVREGKPKGQSVESIDQIIKEAERLAKIKATPRRPVIQYMEKQKRHTGDKAVSQSSTSDPKRSDKNEAKEGRGKGSREAVGTKQVSTLNPAPRVAGSNPGKADKKADTKASAKVTREVAEKKQTSNLNAGLSAARGFEREDKRRDNEVAAKTSYENTGTNSGSSLTPVIEEIISNSVNKYSKFPPVNVQQNQKPESKSAVKDREIQQFVRGTNEYEEDPDVSLQGKSGPARDTPKPEKKGMNRDAKGHAVHRATATKESGFHQSGYISIGPMNKLARFQRNGRNMIYDVTSLSDNKISGEVEHDPPYAHSSRHKGVYNTREGRDAAVSEDVIGIRTLVSSKRSYNEHDGKYAPRISNRPAKEIADSKESEETKGQLDNQVQEARYESRDVGSAKLDLAGHLRSLSSFDDKSNKIAEAPLQKAEISDKGASKRTVTDEESSRSEQEANYEKMPENAPSAGVTRSSRRTDDVSGTNDAPLLNALRKSIAAMPLREPEQAATAFQCPAGGSYPYRHDDRSYYSCVPTGDGSGFVATLRSCSEDEIFDPITRSCTSREIMPSLDYKSSQLLQSAAVVARSPADEPLENPCTAEGRISNPYDCSAFYLCLPKRPGLGSTPDFFHIALRCPKGSIFDTDSRQCVEGSPATCIPEYKLLDKLRRRRGRLRSQTSPSPSHSPFRGARSADEACPRPGRFARAGGGCADYVLCARPGGVGPLLAVPVRCPPGLAFSSERSRCVTPDVAGCQPGP